MLHATEGVWGLAASPMFPQAMQKLNAVKGAPPHKPLLLATGNMQHAHEFLEFVDETQRQVIKDSWPGHETWIFTNEGEDGTFASALASRGLEYPAWARYQGESIALRVTDFALIVAITDRLGTPVCSTSANMHGSPPVRTLDQVPGAIQQAVDYVAAAVQCGDKRSPSRIRLAATGQVVREHTSAKV